jgi:hypothetical protein
MSKQDFQLGFEISPIILVGGIAAAMGGMLPIIALTQAQDFDQGLLQGTDALGPDEYFAKFKPVPGGTLVSNQIGQYPYANQAVAANAIIAQPLNISLVMICPARGDNGGYDNKLTVLTSLKQQLDAHTAAGGTYIVATPGFLYQSCILVGLRDISSSDSKQVQIEWQWDFVTPLLTQTESDITFNSLLSIMNAQLPPGTPAGVTPSWSGLPTGVGGGVSGIGSSLIPSASNILGMLSGGSFQTAASAYISGGSNTYANISDQIGGF